VAKRLINDFERVPPNGIGRINLAGLLNKKSIENPLQQRICKKSKKKLLFFIKSLEM